MSYYARLRRMLWWGISLVLAVSAMGMGLQVMFFAFDKGPFEVFWVGLALMGVGAWCAARAIIEMITMLYEQFKEFRSELRNRP